MILVQNTKRHFLKRTVSILLISVLTTGLIGCNRSHHETDTNITSETISENSVSSASDDTLTDSTAEDIKESTAFSPIPDIKIRSHVEYEFTEDYRPIYEIEYDELILSEETKSAYPELDAAIASLNEEKHEQVSSNWDTAVADALEQFQSNPDYFNSYSDTNNFFIRRADSEVLSIASFSSGYSGGVHGYDGHDGIAFHTRTGEIISLDEIITDRNALSEYVLERLKVLYPDIFTGEDNVPEIVKAYFDEDGSYDTTWVLEPHGITFYFPTYLLGPYALGEPVVTILFSEKPELFTDNFTESTLAWGQSFRTYEVLTIDLNKDTIPDSLSLRELEDEEEYGYYTGIEILINDASFSFDMAGFDYSPGLVRDTDGKYYLFVTVHMENDWRQLYIFDINGDSPVKTGEMEGKITCDVPEYTYTDHSYTEVSSQLYNPEHFNIGTRMQLLSTYSGVRSYTLGENGMPEPLSNWYITDGSITLTSKVELQLDVVDETTGTPLEKGISIPAGSAFLIYRTDNESYVDCKLSDGRIVRVPVESTEWPQMINGTDIESVFDGIMFAG